ncbi:hypothetical protein EJ06DRAFT_300448 [Trichodelitschia bisporula]|uniref:Uncharacterized protein n=1 Tax=Trichodelitschia bisporula TaxID=703511 RepID=A0A6G1I7A3_9PEZI|nr:hypothetical protein EJ06DRAFT_300448 [Trichodelitschia bisporula]
MPPFEAWEEAGHLVPKHLYEYYNLDRRGKPRGTKARGRAPIEVIPFTPGPDTVSPAIHQPGPSGSPSGQQHGLNGSSSVNGLYQKPDTGIDNTHAQKQASEDVLVASSHATSGHQIIKPGYIVGDHVTSGTERHIGVLTATLNNSTDLIDIGITAAQAPVTVPTVTECPTNKHVVNSHLCRVTCLGMAPAYITLASGASGNSPVVAVHTPELVQPDANRSATPTEIPPPVDDLLRREHIAAQNLAIPIVGDGGSSAIVGSLEEAPVSPATTAPVNAGLVNTAATPGSSLLSVIDPNDPISLELVQLLLKFRLSQTGSQGA